MLARNKMFFILGGILLSQLLASAAVGLTLSYKLGHTRAPEGTKVLGEDISRLTLQEAVGKLQNQVPNAVVLDGKVYNLTTTKSISKLQGQISELFLPSVPSTFRDVLRFLNDPRYVQGQPQIERLDRQEMLTQLEQLKPAVNRPSSPATIVFEGNDFVKHAAQEGRDLDVQATLGALLQASNEQPVPLKVNPVIPHPDNNDIDRITDVLGDSSTTFDPRNLSRTHNIKLAAQALNGKLVAPGEVFSFNSSVGERTMAAGYLSAPVIVNQQVVPGDGGGVCQDSSTLYQAVLQSHLTVVERHSHSLPVSYVPVGGDATVAYGLLDFRFRNDTPDYILTHIPENSDVNFACLNMEF